MRDEESVYSFPQNISVRVRLRVVLRVSNVVEGRVFELKRAEPKQLLVESAIGKWGISSFSHP